MVFLVFFQVASTNESCSQGVLLSQHGKHEWRAWADVQTVNGRDDVDDAYGNGRMHPKVFAGFWKHANFFQKDTDYWPYITSKSEYRSDDYYFLPEAGDMIPVSDIHGKIFVISPSFVSIQLMKLTLQKIGIMAARRTRGRIHREIFVPCS